MIKENKKNKIMTFLCACLMVCASALGLVSSVGSTYALTSSKLTNAQVTDYIDNYQNYDYTTIFDGYYDVPSNFSTSNLTITMIFKDFVNNDPINITLPNGTYVNNSDGLNFALFYESNGFSSGLENNASIISQFYVYGVVRTLYVTGVNGMINFLNKPFAVFSFSADGVNWYNFVSVGAYQRNVAYRNGLADADTTSAYNNGYNTGYSDGQTAGYNSGITQGQNNVINNPNDYNLYTQAQYEQHYNDGYNSGVTQGQNNVINNPNAYGLYTQSQYQQNYTDGYNAGVTQGQNNVINNPNDFGLNTNQQLEDSYNQGFVDGEQSSDAYQNGYDTGYTDGSNEVINNPNNYNLYTQAQYEQNYEDGYNQGVLSAQYGVFANVRITGGFAYQLTDDTLYSVSISNEDFNFSNGVITPKQTLIDKYDTFIELLSQQSNVRFKQARIIFNDLNFIYNSDIDINFVNLNSLNDTSTAYFYAFVNNTSNYLFRTYTPVLENGIVVGYNIGNYDNVVDGTLVTEIRYDMLIAPPVVNDSVIGNYSLKPNNLLVYEKSIAFDNGYDVGYADGTSSDVVNNAYDNGYDKGVIEGFNDGYAQGLANQDNATFASMISAVIDVPINAMRNLFNFELLGINLFGFFTALFTLLVVITIVRLILGGK